MVTQPRGARIASPGAQTLVTCWIDAYNAHDLEGMLASLDHDVDYRPLRLGGLTGMCRGHDGVRHWFAQLGSAHCHRIELAELRELSDGHVLATGAVRIADASDVAPFCGAYHTASGPICSSASSRRPLHGRCSATPPPRRTHPQNAPAGADARSPPTGRHPRRARDRRPPRRAPGPSIAPADLPRTARATIATTPG